MSANKKNDLPVATTQTICADKPDSSLGDTENGPAAVKETVSMSIGKMELESDREPAPTVLSPSNFERVVEKVVNNKMRNRRMEMKCLESFRVMLLNMCVLII